MELNPEEDVRRQAETAIRNRGVARELENRCRVSALEGSAVGEFFCTCGRSDCDDVLVLTLDEFRFVQEKPYRFLVATDHATCVDVVIRRADGYDVVEIVERHRRCIPQSELLTWRSPPA